jgi:dTDP-4-dehydrorhamnose 3,5-epimerase
VDQKAFIIIGANGQLGTALRQQYPKAKAVDSAELDITNYEAVDNFDWSGITTIFNAAGYTNVDGSETPEGTIAARKVNVSGVNNLANAAKTHGLVLVHISSDYVFDGTIEPHTEEESFSPLSVYGETKAEADTIVADVPKYYILRTSWVIGEGKNFVRTMLELGQKGINPTVVADQTGRLTFKAELLRAIDHLLTTEAQFGIYNVSNDGPVVSWANIASKTFELAGLPNTVTDTTTAEYFAGKPGIARRPLKSALDLSKVKSTGFVPRDWQDDLGDYVAKELAK